MDREKDRTLKKVMSLLGGLEYSRKEELGNLFVDALEYMGECEKEMKSARTQLSEYDKDEEIQKLKAEIDDLKHPKTKRLCFVIEEEELKKINEWEEKHTQEKHNGSRYAGAIGGRYTYKFTPTSIGEVGEIICSCGEKFCFRELE